jgi:hypothetical protein
MKNFKKVVVMFLFICSVFLTKNVFAEETTFETVDETQVNSLYIGVTGTSVQKIAVVRHEKKQ